MVCDKCGGYVPPENDATLVAVHSGELSLMGLMTVSQRHFLPTENCEGSPSRAQYIEGQPLDQRGYTYNPELEPVMRKAFMELQEEVKNGKYDYR